MQKVLQHKKYSLILTKIDSSQKNDGNITTNTFLIPVTNYPLKGLKYVFKYNWYYEHYEAIAPAHSVFKHQ